MRFPADDEVTYRRNTEAYERCDLVPYVLAGVESIYMLTTVMEQKLKMLLFCSPTAVVRFAGPGQAERGAASYATGPGNGSQFALDSPLEFRIVWQSGACPGVVTLQALPIFV
jgi:isopentenyl diphosphate isomerase/L-lactate dehydrogenase-like FMN-dependent dehydrogenase